MREAQKQVDRLKRKAGKPGGLSQKEEQRFADARSTTRKHSLKILGTVGLGSAAALTAAVMSFEPSSDRPQNGGKARPAHTKADKRSPIQPPIPQQKAPTIPELFAMQEEQKFRTLRALEKFENFSERTKELVNMLRQNAFYSIPRGPKMTQHLMRDDPGGSAPSIPHLQNSHAFEVVFMPEVYAHAMPSSVIWEGKENIMRIATDLKSDEWLGIVLLHELSHVWDQYFGGENPNDPQQWTEGEVRAHELECKLIESLNPEKYARLIEEAGPLWRAKNFRGIMDLADKYFPVYGGETQRAAGVRYGAILVCAAFAEAPQERTRADVYRTEILPLLKRAF